MDAVRLEPGCGVRAFLFGVQDLGVPGARHETADRRLVISQVAWLHGNRSASLAVHTYGNMGCARRPDAEMNLLGVQHARTEVQLPPMMGLLCHVSV